MLIILLYTLIVELCASLSGTKKSATHELYAAAHNPLMKLSFNTIHNFSTAFTTINLEQ